jgi:hypothetical protein
MAERTCTRTQRPSCQSAKIDKEKLSIQLRRSRQGWNGKRESNTFPGRSIPVSMRILALDLLHRTRALPYYP